ncbi:MAG: PepSY domain-containing protein [Dehalococcoidia bacterium]|nr:PepSY domain-containing protein [Dehalococcoidia bacterium]
MTLGKRVYWALALVAVLALAGAAVTMASGITSAGNNGPSTAAQTCDEGDDASEEAASGADTDDIEEQCGPDDEGEDGADGADTAVPCSQPDGADDDAAENASGADTDNIEEQCGSQGQDDEGDDADEQKVAPGQIDDGAELLPQASITLEQAIAAAQGAASGAPGEVDLEQYLGKLVFNVDIGENDVKVDAATGAIVGVEADD